MTEKTLLCVYAEYEGKKINAKKKRKMMEIFRPLQAANFPFSAFAMCAVYCCCGAVPLLR